MIDLNKFLNWSLQLKKYKCNGQNLEKFASLQ